MDKLIRDNRGAVRIPRLVLTHVDPFPHTGSRRFVVESLELFDLSTSSQQSLRGFGQLRASIRLSDGMHQLDIPVILSQEYLELGTGLMNLGRIRLDGQLDIRFPTLSSHVKGTIDEPVITTD